MKNTKVKEENFICIQGWMISKLNLKGNDLLVYAIIYGFSQDGNSWFSGGLKYLADWVNGTKRGVQKNLDSLEEKSLIKKVSEEINGIVCVKYKYNPQALLDRDAKENIQKKENEQNQTVEQSSMGIEQSSMGCGTEFHGGIEQSSTNNITIINHKKNTKDTSPGSKPSRADLIKSVVDCWNSLSDYGIRQIRRLSQDSIRYGQLNARINDYGYENVIQAIDNIKKSPYLQGSGDRGWMIDFDWFVKPNNFCKVWEGKYINERKGKTNNDSGKGYFGNNNTADSEQSGRKYNPADFFGDQWKK